MNNHYWSCLLVGLLLTTTIACKPVIEETAELTNPVQVTPRSTAVTQPVAIEPPATATPPQSPTAAPTTAHQWQIVGGAAAGLQFTVPSTWVNLSGQLDTATVTTPLGLIALLVADSERTGRSLLANKTTDQGAYAAAIIAELDLPSGSPSTNLNRLLLDLGGLTPLDAIAPITNGAAAGPVTGARVDVVGDPLNLFAAAPDLMQSRIFFFMPASTETAVSRQAQALYIFGAPQAEWDNYAGIFDSIAETLVIYDIWSSYTVGEGAVTVRGTIQSQNPVTGNLSPEVSDIWTFDSGSARYATIRLSPDNNSLDLAFTIISPSGQTVAYVDEGYAGATEIAADIPLAEVGTYVIEVSEFFREGGRYRLSLLLTEEPLYASGGRIDFGQNIRGELPGNQQHIWTFAGEAGQLVSIVIAPVEETLDLILDLYGPDGTRLVALDEGFSGDPEVISGFQLPVTGDYSILVRSFANEGGSYNLSLDEGQESIANFYDAGDIIYGETRAETLQANEVHAWFFSGSASDEVIVELVPLDETLDLTLWLLTADVERLATRDKYGIGEAESIDLSLPADGDYIILVQDFYGQPGGYELRLRAKTTRAPDYAGVARYGQPVRGTLAPEQAVVWLFEAEAGALIDVTLLPTDGRSDLAFVLQNPAGQTVLEVDETLGGSSEQLRRFVIDTSGNWRIIVREFFDESAAYELLIELVE
ncbi:MAG: hypothetical protein R6X32_01190 [Chloroflexota bacterium]